MGRYIKQIHPTWVLVEVKQIRLWHWCISCFNFSFIFRWNFHKSETIVFLLTCFKSRFKYESNSLIHLYSTSWNRKPCLTITIVIISRIWLWSSSLLLNFSILAIIILPTSLYIEVTLHFVKWRNNVEVPILVPPITYYCSHALHLAFSDEGLTPTKDGETCLRRLSMFRKEVH